MKKYIFIIVMTMLSIVIISYLILNSNDNNEVSVQFSSCIDGDTAKFIVDGKVERVRFLGIDTPESTNYIEEYGIEASDYVCNILTNSNDIRLEYDINSDRYDKYNRLLAWVIVDEINLSELLVSLGYAEVKYIYGNYKYVDNLCLKQDVAYQEKLGIWSNNYNKYQDNYCLKR